MWMLTVSASACMCVRACMCACVHVCVCVCVSGYTNQLGPKKDGVTMRFSKTIIMFHPVGAGIGHVLHHVARMGGGIVEKENARAGGDTLSTESGRGGGCGVVLVLGRCGSRDKNASNKKRFPDSTTYSTRICTNVHGGQHMHMDVYLTSQTNTRSRIHNLPSAP